MESNEIISKLKSDLRAVSDIKSITQKFIWTVAKALDASQGAFYILSNEGDKTYAKLEAGYAYFVPESQSVKFEMGEGLVGQVAQSGEIININEVPNGYIQVISGLGKASPSSLIVYPIIKQNKVVAVFEIASFHQFKEDEIELINQASALVAEMI